MTGPWITPVRTNKIKKADVALQARGLKLEDPDGIAPFVVKAFKRGKQWRADEAASLVARIAKNPDREGKAHKRDVERLRFLVMADLDEQAAARGKAPASAPIADVERSIPAESDPGSVLPAVVVGGLALYFLSHLFV